MKFNATSSAVNYCGRLVHNQRMAGGGLTRLLAPRHIAVFGGQPAARAIAAADSLGYSGDIWPVHPSRSEIGGRPCFRSVADLPTAPDAAFIGVNRHATLDIVRDLAASGAGGAVCYASGFRETTDTHTKNGTDLQDDLTAAAGAMPILGPNCYGFINYLDRVALWPDLHGGQPVDAGVAIIGQSSNILLNLTMQRRGLPVAYIIAAGNQATIGLTDLLAHALDDPRVTAVGLHIEGLDNPVKFASVADRARRLGKPIVVLPVGRSAAARAASLGHTASLTGPEHVMAAYFQRLGVAQVASLTVLLECLKLLHIFGPLAGNRLSAMSCSGGEAALMADAVTETGLQFPALSDAAVTELTASLPPLVHINNPLDYHTFIWADRPRMAATFTAMLRDGFDLNLLILDWPKENRADAEDWRIALAALKDAVRETKAPTALLATLPENLPESVMAETLAANIVPLLGIQDGLAAIAAAAAMNTARSDICFPGNEFRDKPVRTLDEAESKAVLRSADVPVPEHVTGSDAGGLLRNAEKLTFPVALKALGLAHKSERGAVHLNLHDTSAVAAALKQIPYAPGGYLLESMVPNAVGELLVSFTEEAGFGIVLTIASGGILTELLQDKCQDLLPVTAGNIRDMIQSLKMAPQLHGYRGQPAGDIAAAVEAVMQMQAFVLARQTGFVELEVNPLLVLPEGCGVSIVDCIYRKRDL